MCPHCLGQCTKSEIEQPEANELWTLFRAAHEQYQSEIVNGNKRYHRYVNDFVSYNFPFFGKENLIREHVKNINLIYELLTERRDLVDKFIAKTDFSEEDFQQMMVEFNTVYSEPVYYSHIALFSDEQISMITDYLNNHEKMFVKEVTKSQIKDFFECKLTTPLTVKSLPDFAIFLDKMYFYRLIVRRWAHLIDVHKMIMSQRTMRPATKRGIIARLSEKKKSLEDYNKKHNDFINELLSVMK